ncbi:Metallo-dependent phosphatase-like protein [Usnea florida]
MESLQSLFSCFARSKTSFQIMSDLHLEVGQQYADFGIPAVAPYLILAGDVGRLKDYQPYLDFLRRQCRQFTKVFLILGNHEFFGTSHTEGLRLARCLEKEPGCEGKLNVLIRDRVDMDPSQGITILGCSLQSRIPEDAKAVVQTKVNDFKHIEGWTVNSHNSEHQQDVEWLRREIHNIRNEKDLPKRNILVITHHAPTVRGTSKPSDLANPWSCAFSTDLLGDKALADTQVWVFGHTHFTSDFKQEQVRLVSNQRGYIINGLPLQGQSSRNAKASQSSRLNKITRSTCKEFDVRKVIKM